MKSRIWTRRVKRSLSKLLTKKPALRSKKSVSKASETKPRRCAKKLKKSETRTLNFNASLKKRLKRVKKQP
jgi:hypothetical protein